MRKVICKFGVSLERSMLARYRRTVSLLKGASVAMVPQGLRRILTLALMRKLHPKDPMATADMSGGTRAHH